MRKRNLITAIVISALLIPASLAIAVVFGVLQTIKDYGKDTTQVFQLISVGGIVGILIVLTALLILVYRFRVTENKLTRKKVFSTKNIARIAVMTALSYALYMFVKFKLPFFPPFLDMQISDVPALLCGFMMGPWAGCAVVFFKVLLKLPFTSTVAVGELADLIIGIAFVLPSSFVYKYKKTKNGARLGLIAGLVISTFAAVLVNRLMLVPLYVVLLFGGDITGLVKMCAVVYKSITVETFYQWYLFVAILPFNLLRGSVCAIVTFFLYKPLGKFFNMMVSNNKKELRANENCSIINSDMKIVISHSENETIEFARKMAESAKGGEVYLLSGDLGAGKTVFAKGVAIALGIDCPIKSPTFTLCCEYQGTALKLWHFDAYRLANGREGEAAGLDEHFGDKSGVCVIEWPEQIESILPTKATRIKIKTLDEHTKEITVYDE